MIRGTSGKSGDYGPRQWKRKEGADFINYLSMVKNVPVSHILFTQRGRNGGTYAHWQIALAYAKYLSPELEMKVNELVKQYVTADPELTKNLIDRTEDEQALAVEQYAPATPPSKFPYLSHSSIAKPRHLQ